MKFSPRFSARVGATAVALMLVGGAVVADPATQAGARSSASGGGRTLIGLFRLTPGTFDGGHLGGSWFRMLQPGASVSSGPYMKNGKLTADMSSWAASWNNQNFNQGAPKPVWNTAAKSPGQQQAQAAWNYVSQRWLGSEPKAMVTGASATGTLDTKTDKFVLYWTSLYPHRARWSIPISESLTLPPPMSSKPGLIPVVPARDRVAEAIVVEDATKVIEGVTVLNAVSFTAQPGRVTAFLGPNGAGKSTTLRAILGIDHLTSGRATIGGRSFRDHRRPVQVVGALLTPDAAHSRRTARGHLTVVATSNGLPRMSAQRALELAGIVPIADLLVGRMSLGMRQRLGLATALIGDPAVLILDEPHNGLDAAAIRWLRVVLRALADAGRTVLVSSHLMSEIELICDDVVVISGGRILVASTLAELVGCSTSASKRVPLEERYLHLVGEL